MKEFVDAPWAKQAVMAVDRVVAEHNKSLPKNEQMLIAWGNPHGEDLDDEMQFGLLNFKEMDFELRITDRMEGRPSWIRLSAALPRTIRLRVTPREVFNTIEGLVENCALVMFRREDTDKIDVFAIETHLYVASLSSAILLDALESIALSVESIHQLLVSDDGPDYWEEAGEDDGDEDEDE